ncbi:MAG: beta-phosphoglucomutase family hydrolase [Dehalococcoidales bacterium]
MTNRQEEDNREERPRVPISTDKSAGLCIGCGRNNPFGLKLSFQWDGKTARTEFTPTKFYQGWPDIVHGGIITTMLDEAMGHAMLFSGFFEFLTAGIQVKLKRPALVGEPLVITASVTKNEGRSVEVEGAVSLPDGTLVAAGTATQVIIETGIRLEAVLWDMDGVIADTGPYHLKAWHEVFGKRGLKYSDDDFRRNFGKRNDAIIRSVVGGCISSEEVAAIAAEKETAFRQRAKSNLKPFPGAIELINSLKDYGVKVALASSAPIENIQLVTRELGIDNCFDVVVWGREVTESKPNPQGFLLAAQRLKVEPRNCVVIEDSVAGVTAAKQAGMKCLAVTNTNPSEKLAEADLVVDTLVKVNVADLAGLFYFS